ncbi:hypothetical protein [Roseomonas mucosa]
MNEKNRQARNRDRLAECYPFFSTKLIRVIERLEIMNLRPRIQDAWRSPEEQLKAFQSGHSKLRFGFHNVTGHNGEKEALAVDILDDNAPLKVGTNFVLQLAVVARAEGLDTGILWGLPAKLRAGTEAAIAAGNYKASVKIGWDPCHVEVTGISLAEVKAGNRPG